MGFFDSPREEQAPGLYKGQLSKYDSLIGNINNMQSGFSDVNTIGDIMSRFGLKKRTARSVSDIFNPARASIATQMAQANKRAAARMSGSNAMPELSFGNITSSFIPAMNDLESNAAQTGLNVERSDESQIADLLNNILTKKDQYGFQKKGLQSNALAGRSGAVSNFVNSLSDASSFDDLMSLGSTISKFF